MGIINKMSERIKDFINMSIGFSLEFFYYNFSLFPLYSVLSKAFLVNGKINKL